MSNPINIFIIYAREDIEIKQRLLLHLNPFKNAFGAEIWHDGNIEAGQEWKFHIQSRLNQTDLFILLVSVDFMNSEFIHQVEFQHAIDRHKAKKSIVVPVIIDYCQWDIDIPLKEYTFNLTELQVLPNEGKPIGEWKTTGQAYDNIASGIRKVLSTIKNQREQKQEMQRAESEMGQTDVEEQRQTITNEDQHQTQYKPDKPVAWEKPKQGTSQKKYLLIVAGLILLSFIAWFVFRMSSSRGDELASNTSVKEYNTVVPPDEKLKIGLPYQGGIIFYMDEGGKHGLIAATEDFREVYVNWNKGINDGNRYRGGGYSDWRIPTKEEIKSLVSGKGIVRNGHLLVLELYDIYFPRFPVRGTGMVSGFQNWQTTQCI